MIANDLELNVTLERIARFQAQVANLRKAETNPENYHASVSGFLAEIDRMQLEVREYLSTHPFLTDFHWQSGYGVFSVSPSHLGALRKYIANQNEHHVKETFQDEFRRLLQKYNIDYNEKYVWD